MIYTLHQGKLTAAISDIGGQLCALTYQGCQLIWQGDDTHWADHAPLLFPFCGRVKNGQYTWQNKQYPMPIHGFLNASKLICAKSTQSSVTFRLTDTPDSRKIYPFSFELLLHWQLTQEQLFCETVITAKDGPLCFSFGAHPGFCLPCDDAGFYDAALTFDRPLPIRRIELTESGFFTGRFTDYRLSDGTTLPLSPDPALGCGLFLEPDCSNRAVTLKASALPADLRIEFDDFPYLGLWHSEGGAFLCIEPWQGLPALNASATMLENKPGNLTLSPGQKKHFRFSVMPAPKPTATRCSPVSDSRRSSVITKGTAHD